MNIQQLPTEILESIMTMCEEKTILILMRVSVSMYRISSWYRTVLKGIQDQSIYQNRYLLAKVYQTSNFVYNCDINSCDSEVLKMRTRRVLKFKDFYTFYYKYQTWKLDCIPQVEDSLLCSGLSKCFHVGFVIQSAAKLGHHKIVSLLLSQPTNEDITPYLDSAIRYGCFHGHQKVVNILLRDGRADPSIFDNFCIQMAAQQGHYEVVRELIHDNRVDPTAFDNYAIKFAHKNGYHRIVKLLLNHPRVNPEATGLLVGDMPREQATLQILWDCILYFLATFIDTLFQALRK
jgi:ribosomal protein S26